MRPTRTNRLWVATGVFCLFLGSACSKTEEPPPGTGSVSIGEIEAALTFADCANTAFGTALGAIGETDLGVRVQVEVTPGPDGAAVVVTGDVNGESRFNFSAGGTEITESDTGVTVAGSFLEFGTGDRPDEIPGTIASTCPRDRDPGGGFLSLGGQQVDYDLVTCFESERTFNVRASGGDPSASDSLTIERRPEIGGWLDRLEAGGNAVLSDEMSIASELPITEAVALVAINDNQILMEERSFGEDQSTRAALNLTCGIHVSSPTQN